MPFRRPRPAVLFLLLLTACRGTTSPAAQSNSKAPTNARAVAPAAAVSPDCVIHERGPAPAELGLREDLFQVRSLMVWREQVRRPSRYRATAQEGAPFPGVAFRKVRAFNHGAGRAGELDTLLPDCVEQVLSKDGRLCPSVVAPGGELTADQVERLLTTIRTPRPSRQGYLLVDFDPRVSFVFEDATGAPVADVRIGFGSGRWSLSNAVDTNMPEDAVDELAALSRELNMGAPTPSPIFAGADTPEKFKRAQEKYWETHRAWQDSGAPERPSRALGIDPKRKLKDMSDDEKRMLCAWRVLETRSPLSLEFKSGLKLQYQTYDECLKSFPACDEELGAVEGTAFHRTTGGRFAAPIECIERWVTAPTGQCLWGIRGEQ